MKIVTMTLVVVVTEVDDDAEMYTREELQSIISREGLDIFQDDAKIIVTNIKVEPL